MSVRPPLRGVDVAVLSLAVALGLETIATLLIRASMGVEVFRPSDDVPLFLQVVLRPSTPMLFGGIPVVVSVLGVVRRWAAPVQVAIAVLTFVAAATMGLAVLVVLGTMY